MKKLLFSAMIAASLCSCKSETKSSFDLLTAQKEIDEANRAFENYVSQGDSIGLVTNVYTKDAKFMNPNNPSAEGRAAVTSAIAGIFNAGITGIKLTTIEIWGDENSITEEGSFQLNIKDGTIVEKGKYLVLWKKEDGKWKLHRDMFSSDMPIPSK